MLSLSAALNAHEQLQGMNLGIPRGKRTFVSAGNARTAMQHTENKHRHLVSDTGCCGNVSFHTMSGSCSRCSLMNFFRWPKPMS